MLEGNPIAQCPLRKADDKLNQLLLSDQELIVKVNGRDFHYPIESLSEVYVSERKLLIPIIGGSLCAIFSVLAYVNDIMHPWILLFLLISGILIIYYGVIGTPAIILRVGKYHEHYLIKDINQYLSTFISFLNNYLLIQRLPEYFILIDEKEWKEAEISGYLSINNPLRLFTSPIKRPDKITLKLSLEEHYVNINYISSPESQELEPYVSKDVPVEACVRV